MPILNPMVPGDVPYPQYSVTTTEDISASLQINKGRLYQPDASGDLIDVASSLVDGFFQAKATPVTISGAAGIDSVQVLGPRTRMIFTTTEAGLSKGNDVIYVAGGTDVVGGDKTSLLYVGKIFEIYTRNTDSTKKKLTEVDDEVVVETVQA